MRPMANVFKALADETRLSMLGLLFREGELCVCDFVEVLSITQSKASRHLRYLVNAGLLQDRRDAVWVYFRIAEAPGEAQAAVLSGLRQMLPGQVTAGLLGALKIWRKSRTRDGLRCGSRATRGLTTRGGRR